MQITYNLNALKSNAIEECFEIKLINGVVSCCGSNLCTIPPFFVVRFARLLSDWAPTTERMLDPDGKFALNVFSMFCLHLFSSFQEATGTLELDTS